MENRKQKQAVGEGARKIGRQHLAFFRGYLQGLDLKTLSDHYLATGMDLRIAKRTLHWLALELSMAARRQGQHAYARLLHLDPARLQPFIDERDRPPTLEDFRQQRDPSGDFYGERELLAMYAQAYPPNRKAQRNARLRDRQLKALDSLYERLACDPAGDDPVGAWFDVTLAARLENAKLHTLRDLLDHINARGYRWWVSVPRLGEKGAQRLVDWLVAHQPSLGIALIPRALSPLKDLAPAQRTPRPMATAMVPLEQFIIPQDMDGSRGSNRAEIPRCKLAAHNDYDALRAWLRACATNPHTFRAYRKEVERWLLWSILERAKPLSSQNSEDGTDYRDFLWSLGRTPDETWPYKIPQTAWLAVGGGARWSTAWRPFDGPLSDSSQRTALTILRACCEWLTRQRYLDSNPWDGVPPRRKASTAIGAGRSLTREQWRALLTHGETLPRGLATARLHFILRFGYMTGLRVSELSQATLGDLEPITGKDINDGWMLKVIGKGGRPRRVPMPSALMAALRGYLAQRGLNPGLADLPGSVPLIATLENSDKSLSASVLYKNLKQVFGAAATTLAEIDPVGARRLATASPHWLRHTYATHALESNVPIEVVQRNLGHASLSTTTIYVTAEDQRRYREIERFSQESVGEAG